MVAEFLAKVEDDGEQMEMELWGNAKSGTSQSTDLFASPKFKEIVYILLDMPILTTPTLNWLRQKRAQMARAQLEALYTQEELAEMYKQVK